MILFKSYFKKIWFNWIFKKNYYENAKNNKIIIKFKEDIEKYYVEIIQNYKDNSQEKKIPIKIDE